MLLCAAALAASAAEAQLTYVDPISELTSGCFLQGMRLEGEPMDGTIPLEDAAEPLYGVLTLAGGAYPLVVDRGAEPATLHLDSDQDGTLEPVAWTQSETDGRYRAQVTLELFYEEEAPRAYGVFLVWDPWVPTLLIYCRGAYYEGTIELDGVEYRLAILDEDTDGRYDDLDAGRLYIDTDGDGELTTTADSHEAFVLVEPFNLDGVTYEVTSVAADGSAITIEASDRSVAPKYPLGIGFPAPPFEAVTLDGETVSLEALAGSIVILDFWAAWCAPCVAELPTLLAIHDAHHEDGVEIVGINKDRSRQAFVDAVERYELPYLNLYDEDDTIAMTYRIAGIPMTYVLDRDGTIVARGLRGETLRAAVQELLTSEPEDPS
jgi:peroxiredoxin